MRLKKRLPISSRTLAAIALAVLLLPHRTLSVPHRMVPLPADLHAALGRGMTHPLYLIAPVIDGELDDSKREKATIDLENKIHLKPGLGQDRVEEAADSYNKITRCPSYPCEVVAENVTRKENSYEFNLQFKIIRRPNDHSPLPEQHPGVTDAWKCRVSGDTDANECRRQALLQMAKQLGLHDQAYHSREQ